MKLAMLRGRSGEAKGTGTFGRRPEARLTVVGEPAQILPWPAERAGEAAGTTVTAEVRTRRFVGNAVEEERYTATAVVPARTPGAILAALADGLAALDGGAGEGGPDERLIIEVRVVA